MLKGLLKSPSQLKKSFPLSRDAANGLNKGLGYRVLD
jgi:hypothetical protein